MLSREEKNRPDWLELEERVIKEEESRVSQANISRESNAFRPTDKSQIPFKPQPDSRISKDQGFLVTSNAVPIYQDPFHRASQNVVPTQVRVPLI
jgi:hypothetical protein